MHENKTTKNFLFSLLFWLKHQTNANYLLVKLTHSSHAYTYNKKQGKLGNIKRVMHHQDHNYSPTVKTQILLLT
jgi:hypothetical protein